MMNPLKKISSADKKMLIGGIASSLIYWGDYLAQGESWYPAELKQQLDPHLPNNGNLLAGIAPPLALYSIVKFGKKTKLKEIADGSILFGLPNITARIICESAIAEGRKVTPPAARFPTANSFSKYFASPSNSRPAPPYASNSVSLSKYAVTS